MKRTLYQIGGFRAETSDLFGLMFETTGKGMNEAHVRNLIKQNHRQRRAPGGPGFRVKATYYCWPKRFRYSAEFRNALTISAALKSPLNEFSLFSQKL